jgi:hypothetical protein
LQLEFNVKLAFGDEPHQMLKVIHFHKHCSCHLQGEYVLDRCFWEPYIRQAVGSKWDMMDLIGGARQQAAIPQQ